MMENCWNGEDRLGSALAKGDNGGETWKRWKKRKGVGILARNKNYG